MTDDKQLITSTRADADERATKAWRLRVAGGSWEDIAQALGMRGGAPAAHRAVKNYFGTVPQIDREMLRGIARARGEVVWLRALKALEASNGAPAAVRAAISVLERQARLDGLDAPTKVEVKQPDELEFEQVVRLAAVGAGLALPEEGDPFEDIEDAEIVEDDPTY